jgi:hypothetical protein
MARCQCGVELTGKRRKCDACKQRPGATPDAAPEVVEVDVDTTPAGLHDRGRVLWAALGQDLSTPAGQVALEACRAADRLDELDSIIAGQGVLNLLQFRLSPSWWDSDENEHVHVTVAFQSVLAEARQQQANFKTLLAEISDVVPAAAKPGPVGPKKSPLDELAERRAAKK